MAYWVQVVEIERVYGGSEEGGWWYDWYNVLYERKTTKRIARKLAKQFIREVCEDHPNREVEFSTLPGNGKVVQKARRGRNRFSMAGGADYMVTVRKCFKVESTTRGMRYE
jgi:hypothetical protein